MEGAENNGEESFVLSGNACTHRQGKGSWNDTECTDTGVAILVEMSVDGERVLFKMLYQFYH
jgi:hypothetical protein